MESRADHSTYARLVTVVLLGLIAIEIYGFITTHPWTQETWYPIGIARFRFYAGLFAGIATPLAIFIPWAIAPVAAILVAAGTIHAVGWAAALSPVLFLASSYSLGSVLVNRKSASLGILLGASVYVLVMTLTARLPIHYWWTWLVLLSLPLPFFRIPHRRRERERVESFRLPLTVLLFILLIHWLMVLKPEAGADGLVSHLAVATNINAHHAYTVSPARLVWAVMPMGADWTYSVVYLLGGEFAARLINFAWFLLCLAMIYTAARRWLPGAAAILLVAVFAATPLAQLITGELFVENFQAALLLGMVTALTSDAPLWLAAALGGTALATKVGSAAFVAVALPFAAARPRRAIAALVLVAAAAPTYLIAWRIAGNPLYPYFNQRFHSPLLPPNASVAEYRFHEPVRWSTLYDLTFHTHRFYEGQDGSFGFQFLVLIPIAVLVCLLARRARAFAVIGVGGMLLVLLSTPNARYLYPALPLLTVASAAALTSLAEYRIALCYLAVCAAANTWFIASSSWYHKGFYLPKPLSHRWEGFHISMVSATRDVALHFRRVHPNENGHVLLAADIDQADLSADAHESDWHEPPLDDALHRALDLPAMARLMDEWQIRYVIARRPGDGSWVRPAALRELLTWCATPEYEYEDYYLARLDAHCLDHPPSERPLQTVGRGVYDDFNAAMRFRGDWDHRDDFDGPHLHSISYTDVAGAEAALAFNGTAFTYVYTKAPNRGIVELWIDGTLRASLDAWSRSVEWQQRFRYCCLAPGRHELAIRVTGRKQRMSEGTFVDVDAIEIE
jgi:hypothetical protein